MKARTFSGLSIFCSLYINQLIKELKLAKSHLFIPDGFISLIYTNYTSVFLVIVFNLHWSGDREKSMLYGGKSTELELGRPVLVPDICIN